MDHMLLRVSQKEMGGGQRQTQLRLPSAQKVHEKHLENGTLMFGGIRLFEKKKMLGRCSLHI